MLTMIKIDPTQEFLQSLPETNEVWTQDELKMSTPYSDVDAWARIVLGQLLPGRSILRGPPGLWEKIESRLSYLTKQEKTSLYSNSEMRDDWIKAGFQGKSC